MINFAAAVLDLESVSKRGCETVVHGLGFSISRQQSSIEAV